MKVHPSALKHGLAPEDIIQAAYSVNIWGRRLGRAGIFHPAERTPQR